MPPRPSHFFEALAGVPVHYDRPPVADYGSRGKPRRFHCLPALSRRLDALFTELFGRAPTRFGPAEVILTAGAYVNRPGQHGLGKAFDLDGIHWEQRRFLALEQPRDTLLYLAVQSICHKHFGVVLGYNYNAAHQDHLHIDISRDVRFRPTKSVTFFLQEALNALFDQALEIDGEYGDNTEAALRAVLTRLDIGSIRQPGNWIALLDRIGDAAFELTPDQVLSTETHRPLRSTPALEMRA